MSNIIQLMRESNAELLKAASRDMEKWSKLKHNKESFELFLQFNIAQIDFKTLNGKDDSIICTSNAALIKIIDQKTKEDKAKLINFRGAGINIKDKHFVKTWDLIDKKFKMIYLKSWQIIDFISIFPENILILDELLNKLLK